MIYSKITLSIICLLSMTFCSVHTGENKPAENNTTAAANDGAGRGNIWGVWGGGNYSATDMSQYPYLKGWYIVYQWKQLEPEKDKFDWDYFDNQMKFAASHNLSIGFMVWVGPHSPEWLYSNGVPKVTTNTKKKLADYPWYFSDAYKKRYYGMMQAVFDHIEKYPADLRNKIILWMSAEGSTGDITPYKGYPTDSKYNMTDEQWTSFKQDVWKYMYNLCANAKPKINLLVNQANDGRYLNWLTTNLPDVWVKAGNISHTYQFNGELEYYNRLQKLEDKTIQNEYSSRLRGEITVQGRWFSQNEAWNMYALLSSALHFGLDIFNTSSKYLQNPVDTSTFNFFNFYAGQKNPAKSPGAFCVLRDGLDAADLKRFPESKYGPVLDPAQMDAYNKQMQRKGYSANDNEEDDDAGAGEQGINESNIKNDFLNPSRVNKIVDEYAAYGAKRGDINDITEDTNGKMEGAENEDYSTGKQNKNPNRQGKNAGKRKQQKMAAGESGGGDKATAYQKRREASMVINDIGVNILPDNYYRYLIQYSPNTTSRGYWRVGPGDQPYGRFARGFESKENKTEMFFALDKRFFGGNSGAQNVAIKIIYLDKGNGSWSLNYTGASGKKEAYKITCGNSGNWITKTIYLSDAYFAQKLEHGCDISLKYLSGDNTIFNRVEVLRQ
ncbi:MAG TPA: hypothetical protein PKM63_07130 [Panacibacter sp.]|nr:hypothetical protein [Panacibacter sp.]HNP44042.1 hypothetical protein [Panacibacter sp.]